MRFEMCSINLSWKKLDDWCLTRGRPVEFDLEAFTRESRSGTDSRV